MEENELHNYGVWVVCSSLQGENNVSSSEYTVSG